jgi:hypothetical protein
MPIMSTVSTNRTHFAGAAILAAVLGFVLFVSMLAAPIGAGQAGSLTGPERLLALGTDGPHAIIPALQDIERKTAKMLGPDGDPDDHVPAVDTIPHDGSALPQAMHAGPASAGSVTRPSATGPPASV